MGCEIVNIGGSRAILCGRSPSRRRADCEFFGCRMESAALCDYPSGPRGGTCSRRMCDDHRTSVGDDVDYCPEHARNVKPGPRSAPPLQEALFP